MLIKIIIILIIANFSKKEKKYGYNNHGNACTFVKIFIIKWKKNIIELYYDKIYFVKKKKKIVIIVIKNY